MLINAILQDVVQWNLPILDCDQPEPAMTLKIWLPEAHLKNKLYQTGEHSLSSK